MLVLQALLSTLVGMAAAKSSHHLEPLGKFPVPGWLANIHNPLVRTAFPEANTWYNTHYISNNTFDGPGKNLSLPKDPSRNVPLIEPPPKRRVDPLFPKPVGRIFNRKNENPAVYIKNNASDVSRATPQPPSENGMHLPGNRDMLRQVFGHFFQATPTGSLASGQQLQQVCMVLSDKQSGSQEAEVLHMKDA